MQIYPGCFESVTMTCVAQMFKCYVEYYNQCSVRRRPHCPARPHQSRLTRSFFLELATNLCEVSHCPKCLIRFLMLEVLAGASNKDRALLGAFSGHCKTNVRWQLYFFHFLLVRIWVRNYYLSSGVRFENSCKMLFLV